MPEVDVSPCTPAADALGAGGVQLKENRRFPTSALDSLDLDATCTETRTAADADMLSQVAQEGRESDGHQSNSVGMFKIDKGVTEDTRWGQEKWGSASSANGTITECSVGERGADVVSSLCAVGVERGGYQRQQEAEREERQVRQGEALHLLQPSAQSPVERGRRRSDEGAGGGGGGGGGGGEGSAYRRGRDMLRSPASVRSQAPSAFGPPGASGGGLSPRSPLPPNWEASYAAVSEVLDNFVLDGSGSVESVELSDVKLSDVSAPDSTSSPPLSSEF